jgi:hypothetical protein
MRFEDVRPRGLPSWPMSLERKLNDIPSDGRTYGVRRIWAHKMPKKIIQYYR